MPFTRLAFEKLWTSDKDFPTYEGSENQVREDMQYHPDAIKTFLNEILLRELEGTGGAGLIGDEQRGNIADTLVEIFRHLEVNDQDIRNLAAGEAPEAVRSAKVSFTADGWVQDAETGLYELRILQSRHTRRNDSFGYKLQSKSDVVYRTNTWDTECTDVSYDQETTDIVLVSEAAYDGVIVFFGV